MLQSNICGRNDDIHDAHSVQSIISPKQMSLY